MNPFAVKAPVAPETTVETLPTNNIEEQLYGSRILDHSYQSSSGMRQKNISKFVRFENNVPTILSVVTNNEVKQYEFTDDFVESGSYFTGYYPDTKSAREVIVSAPSNIYFFEPAVSNNLIFLTCVKNDKAESTLLVQKKADALAYLTALENAD